MLRNLTIEEFEKLLNADAETEHLEFKLADNNFNFENGKKSVCGYSVALANEGGGKLILGVTDKKPRKVTGTKVFSCISKLEKDLFNKIHRRIYVQEIIYDSKRVIVINIPSRPIGEALEHDGQYLMRVKDELVPMTSDKFKEITNEAIGDYSAKIINGATISDLSPEAIIILKKLLGNSTRVDKEIGSFSYNQILQDLGLIDKGKVTLAALILLGKEAALRKYIPGAEIRYGYKSEEKEIRNQENLILNGGYLLYYDKIWQKIDSRNPILHLPKGLQLLEKKVFDEETVREALNNAIIHRDYSESEPVILIQTPYTLTITSPGGFPNGINLENIADATKTRNKLIADVLYKCVFVEQFGNGVNLMIRNQLILGKYPPDYSKTDKYRVNLKIEGDIKDIEFAKYILKVANKLNTSLDDKELRILYDIKEGKKPFDLEITKRLFDAGIIEKIAGNKYILSKMYYVHINQ